MEHLKLPTLLIVSENPSIRFWIKKHLHDQFFILEAFDFKMALEAAKTSRLDFVILDSDFENCNPLKLSSEIRQILGSFTPILLITGRLKKSFLNAALESGITDFLNNELDEQELHLRIATGRKAQSLRDKTMEASSALKSQPSDLSTNYLRDKFLLHDQALRFIAKAKKEGIPLCALFIRIDQFEKMGYLMSSEILPLLSHLLYEQLNSSELLIPANEGQFIILLENKTPQEAKKIASNLRLKVEKTPFKTKNSPLHLTISMTLSSLEATEGNFNQMVDISLKALKEANTAANLIIPIED